MRVRHARLGFSGAAGGSPVAAHAVHEGSWFFGVEGGAERERLFLEVGSSLVDEGNQQASGPRVGASRRILTDAIGEDEEIGQWLSDNVPEEAYAIPLGEAKVVRAGDQVTCVAWGAMLLEAFSAAEELAKQGVQVEVIDLRTLWPLDIDALVASVRKTGRLVVVHEAPRTCGFGSELVSLLVERAFLHLEAPPVRVTGYDTPFPLTHEREYLPLAHRIAPAMLETARY